MIEAFRRRRQSCNPHYQPVSSQPDHLVSTDSLTPEAILQDTQQKLQQIVRVLLIQKTEYQNQVTAAIQQLRIQHQAELRARDAMICQLRTTVQTLQMAVGTIEQSYKEKLQLKNEEITMLKGLLKKKYLKQISLQRELRKSQQALQDFADSLNAQPPLFSSLKIPSSRNVLSGKIKTHEMSLRDLKECQEQVVGNIMGHWSNLKTCISETYTKCKLRKQHSEMISANNYRESMHPVERLNEIYVDKDQDAVTQCTYANNYPELTVTSPEEMSVKGTLKTATNIFDTESKTMTVRKTDSRFSGPGRPFFDLNQSEPKKLSFQVSKFKNNLVKSPRLVEQTRRVREKAI